MDTTTLAPSASTTTQHSYLWDSTNGLSTLSTRTYQRTTSTPAICSIYSESWINAASSYYGVDPRPTICGGTRGSYPYPTYIGSSGSSINDNILANLDAQDRELDRRLHIKIIIIAVVGSLVLLSVILSIVQCMRKRKRQRELANLLTSNESQQQNGLPPTYVAEPSREPEVQEVGILPTENNTTVAPSK
jgi:uncharacterized membrane protein YeaQ/YmgE (transglycosylase-associated protein family)